MDTQANTFIGCFIGVFLFDRIVLNRYFPDIRFRKWRLTANLIKFIFWPFALFKPIEYPSSHSAIFGLKNTEPPCTKSNKSIILALRISSKAIKSSKGPWQSTALRNSLRKDKNSTGQMCPRLFNSDYLHNYNFNIIISSSFCFCSRHQACSSEYCPFCSWFS